MPLTRHLRPEVPGFASPSEKLQIVGSKVFYHGHGQGACAQRVPASGVASLCGVLFPLVRRREWCSPGNGMLTEVPL